MNSLQDEDDNTYEDETLDEQEEEKHEGIKIRSMAKKIKRRNKEAF